MRRGIFPKIKGKVILNEPLSKHTTFSIGGPCKAWIEPANEDELSKILRFAKSKRKKIFVIGMGSNVLPKDGVFNGLIIHLGSKHFKKIYFTGTKVKVGAGAKLGSLVNMACKRGLSGIEGLTGIPGTVGGAIFMNAGYKGNIADYLEEIKVMDRKRLDMRVIKQKSIKFGYRQSNLNNYIILEATLRLKRGKKKILLKMKNRLLRIKRMEQPFGYPSAGCIFRNPYGEISAGQYIDMLGLKGKRIGDAKISQRHANFIINLKNAKSSDVSRLINFVIKEVKSRFGIKLIPEIVIL